MKNLPKLVISVIGCESVGLISTAFTIPAKPIWYRALNKPSFSPPNWLFAPVWFLLYFLMGISFYLIWREGFQKKEDRKAGIFFLSQLGLNFLWSALFFGLRSPILGLIDILALLVFIVITMKHFYPLSKIASYLLIPYLMWVSFATLLNVSIIILN